MWTCMQGQVGVLKEALAGATGNRRIEFTAEQRRRLVLPGKALTLEERGTFRQNARPATILAWFRKLAAQGYDSSKWRTPGCRRKEVDIRRLVVSLAYQNPRWGSTRHRGLADPDFASGDSRSHARRLGYGL